MLSDIHVQVAGPVQVGSKVAEQHVAPCLGKEGRRDHSGKVEVGAKPFPQPDSAPSLFNTHPFLLLAESSLSL